MARVRVVDVLHQDGATWVVVECHEGSVSVGDTFAVARRSDGAVANTYLKVDEVALPTGTAPRVQAPGTARLRLSGSDLGLISRDIWLESWAMPAGFPAAPAPGGPPAGMPWQSSMPADALLAQGIPALEVDEPDRLNRWSTAFRLILSIPHQIVLMLWLIALLPVMVIGWLCALVMGRLPTWVAAFTAGFVCYNLRLEAYYLLLTDRFPPFAGAEAEYPVRPLLPPPDRLRRWSVLVRAILAYPAYLLGAVLLNGLSLSSAVIWLIVLIKGSYPRSLFWAVAAVLRFYLRVLAYFGLLTSRYPQRLFLDAMPFVAAPDVAAADQRLPGQPNRRSVHRLIVMFMVLGIGFSIAISAVRTLEGANSVNRQYAAQNVIQAYTRFATTVQDVRTGYASCSAAVDPLSCAETNDREFARAVDAFDSQTQSIDYPSDASDEAATMHAAARRFSFSLHAVAAAPTSGARTQETVDLGLVDRGRAFDDAYRSLLEALGVNVHGS